MLWFQYFSPVWITFFSLCTFLFNRHLWHLQFEYKKCGLKIKNKGIFWKSSFKSIFILLSKLYSFISQRMFSNMFLFSSTQGYYDTLKTLSHALHISPAYYSISQLRVAGNIRAIQIICDTFHTPPSMWQFTSFNNCFF